MTARHRKAPNPVGIHVGQKLRARRMVLGINQKSLGDAVGLTFQQIQKYETGESKICASRIMQFAILLDVPPKYFFDGAPNIGASIRAPQAGDAATVRVAEFIATKDGKAILAACSRLRDPKVHRIICAHVLDLAKALAGPFDD
jgi:transcriptional regulator with XRE-family HTH domain